ncbi:hypothetical protein [Streptomyces sp. NPDC059597]|uniref:hypothetical protein n=1 Tax=Streptomyces sp. NPDC059597 TaxID=3346879 RepID=UPI0036AEB80D
MNTALRCVAAALAILAVSSCTARTASTAPPAKQASDGKATADRTLSKRRTCRGGDLHWGPVRRRDTLVAVSDAHHEEIPVGRTESWTYRLTPLRTLTSAITPSGVNGRVDAHAAVTSLEKRTGLDLARADTVFTLRPGQRNRTVESGRSSGVMVAAVSVGVVEASFVAHGCGDDSGSGSERDARGTLTTWTTGSSFSLLKCGIDEKLSPAEREAETLMCAGDGDE